MSVSQNDFHQALRDPGEPIPPGLVDHNGAPAGRRFNVYRNNVATSLMDAMTDGFPVIQKLLGEENFRNLARLYQAEHPPSSPLMMYFGEAFPDFLRGFSPLAKYPYLGDVAHLEYCLRQSYHAADSTPLEASLLGKLSEAQLLSARFEFAPALKIVASRWPIFGIWRFNSTPNAPKPESVSEMVMITRPEFDPLPEAISTGDAALIDALAKGSRLEAALVQALEIEPAHDFGRILGRLLAGGAITKVSYEEG